MKFRHLEYFVAAAEELNFTHAADRLHVSQERALLEGRIAVGLLVPSDRPLLELLQVRLLTKYPVKLALPKSHPHADKPEIPLSLLKEDSFIGLNRMYPNYGKILRE